MRRVKVVRGDSKGKATDQIARQPIARVRCKFLADFLN